MTIVVTYDDINKGNCSLDSCPVTVALQRHIGSKSSISISRNFIRISKKRGKWKLITLPAAARNFLLNYYKNHSPQPFAFELSDRDVKLLKAAT
jgi:hypothetical protein